MRSVYDINMPTEVKEKNNKQERRRPIAVSCLVEMLQGFLVAEAVENT